MSLRGNNHPIVTRGFRVSRAPSHHTLQGGLPAFLNLHGRKFLVETYKYYFNRQAPVAQKTADELVFRRFQGEGVEFFKVGLH